MATSSKRRGEGIGFAGVGVKRRLLVSREVITETRRGTTHVATRWARAARHRARWTWTPPLDSVSTRGTAGRLVRDKPLSPLLDAPLLESVVRLEPGGRDDGDDGAVARPRHRVVSMSPSR